MRELLLESKGRLTKRGIVTIVAGVFFFLLGFWFAMQSSEVGGYRLTTRLFGGGLTVRNVGTELFACGLVIVAVSIWIIAVAMAERSCWIRVYRDHVEGKPLRLGMPAEMFSLPVQEISSVAVVSRRGMVILQTKGTSYKVVCPRYQEVFRLVGQLIADQQQEKMPRVRRCISCGRILEETAAFCPSCGTRNEGRK